VITVTLQFAVAVALALFGVFALLAARFVREPGPRRDSWLVTGVAFGFYGAISLFQMSFAVVAFRAGPETRLYEAYLAAAPAGNHARTLLLFGFYGMLAWVALRPRGSAPAVARIVAVVLAFGVAGGVFGAVEGPFVAARHLPATAVLDTVGFLLLGSVLILGMQRDSLDRILWICIALHGFRSLFGVLHLSAMAWFAVPGAWAPPAWQLHVFRLVLLSAQVGFAAYRVLLARRGRTVPGLLPSTEPRPTLA
jgi:hypothetical protein